MDSASKAGFLCAELIKDGFPEDKNNFSVIMMNNFSSSETDKKYFVKLISGFGGVNAAAVFKKN